MDKDTLSPALGRLIDAAKAAATAGAATAAASALTATAIAGCLDGAAIMTESERVFVGHSGGPSGRCAGASALDAWRGEGGAEIVAACFARADTADDVLPCIDCRRALAEISPCLPVVLKLKGRWVLTHLDDVHVGRAGG
jgi:cytidine deaminase